MISRAPRSPLICHDASLKQILRTSTLRVTEALIATNFTASERSASKHVWKRGNTSSNGENRYNATSASAKIVTSISSGDSQNGRSLSQCVSILCRTISWVLSGTVLRAHQDLVDVIRYVCMNWQVLPEIWACAGSASTQVKNANYRHIA